MAEEVVVVPALSLSYTSYLYIIVNRINKKRIKKNIHGPRCRCISAPGHCCCHCLPSLPFPAVEVVVVLVEVVMVMVVVEVVVVVYDMAKRDLVDWTRKKSRSSASRGQVTCNVYLDL